MTSRENRENQPAGDVDYELSDGGYGTRRRTDPRIARYVDDALGSASSIINVGAGTGSYEPNDREVTAIEPSESMRAQRPAGSTQAIDATAEDLPFPDDSFDAAMAMVTIHQWKDLDQGLCELRRVSRGPVVILTFDGDALDRFWLADYCPEVIEVERGRYPRLNHIRTVLGGTSRVTEIPVPIDCVDGFTEAFYARPERMVDPAVRAAQSAWTFLAPGVAERRMQHLADDLASGEWDRRYGAWRTMPTFIGSLRLITASP